MKKILLFLVLICGFTYVVKANEGQVDSFGPELVSVSMSKNEISAGETVTINFETIDDISGTDEVEITWCFKTSDLCEYNERLRVTFERVGTDNFVVNYTLPSDIKPGEWVISEVGLMDVQHNSNWYYLSGGEVDISSLNFTAINNDYVEDTVGPVLNDVKIIKNTGPEAPFEMKIQLEVSDNLSDEVEAIINYDYAPLGGTGIMQDRYSCYTSSGKIMCNVAATDRFHKYYLWSIELIDKSGNTSYYGYDIDLMKDVYDDYRTGNSYGLISVNLDMIPSNYIYDTTGPGLRGFEHNKDSVTVPSILVTHYDLEEDGAWFVGGRACFKNDEGTYDECHHTSGEATYVVFYDNVDYGSSVYLYKLELEDNVGNISTYTLDNGDFRKERIIIIEENKTYDLDISCYGDTYLSKINMLSEGSVMCRLDYDHMVAKKEIFDAIKGKNIEVTFRTVEGYEWIINGEDIVNETKDVDLTIKLSLIPKYFLPGYRFPELESPDPDYELAEGESPFDFFNKQKEVHISEYFDYLKTLGYKNSDAIKKKALKSIYTLGDADYYSIIAHATDYKYHMVVNFYPNGELPGNMKVRIKPDVNFLTDFNSFKNLYLYYVDSDNDVMNLEKKADGIKIKSDDYYEINVSHNSEYWLTAENMDNEFSTGSGEISVPKTFDGVYYYVGMMFISLICLFGLSKYLRK